MKTSYLPVVLFGLLLLLFMGCFDDDQQTTPTVKVYMLKLDNGSPDIELKDFNLWCNMLLKCEKLDGKILWVPTTHVVMIEEVMKPVPAEEAEKSTQEK